MVNFLIFLVFFISFILTYITIPFWIRKTKNIGLVWRDMNKYGKPKTVSGSGGIVVVMAFVLGVFYYVAIRTFSINFSDTANLNIFALLSTVLILSIVGIIDDLFDWQHGGLSKRTRILLSFIASIPLVVINAGSSIVNVPFLGIVNLGLFYPLVVIPIGIGGATIAYNSLAGFNGLEAGQGIIILSFLSYVAYITGTPWLSVIGFIMVAALIGFLIYNKYPAKVFPGDSLTWAIGALIAGMAIIGNFEKLAVFVFIPYIIESVLKLRGNLEKQSFGKPNKDGSLEVPYKKFYGIEHIAIKILKETKKSKKVYERDVVYLIHGFQIFIILLAWIIFL